MAGALTENQLVHEVYASLKAASCPLVDGLYLNDTDSMLQLLCAPSQLRTDILAWICTSINPNFTDSKAMSGRSTDPEVLNKEMAALGQELMLCKSGDLDLIRGNASADRQLRFLEQLLTLVPGCQKSAENRTDADALLNEVFAAENLPNLTQALKPKFYPWPSRTNTTLQKETKSANEASGEEPADIDALLQLTQSALEKLQSECDFLLDEDSPAVFSVNTLRVAACDLQQLMSTFSHVYETDLRMYCSKDIPHFSKDTDIFHRVHQLLLACNTELEMLKEVTSASESVSEEVKQLQTQSQYWRHGEKRTLHDQIEVITKRIGEFLAELQS
ncbi:HAUS augmin-like complex subunit 7 [Acanthochromis polyacanthus]|uniref:HAUS augmin-like complex subunit 7 n=1 Tax=Acanthochromis polyacanthus TaxID=80966 RepID=UPI002234C679|nr:HAUS augmin-like complex subunit 7 [Acanthochromis polyacanthus]